MLEYLIPTIGLVLIAIIGAWLKKTGKDKLLEKEFIQKLINDKLRDAVYAQMGKAAKMKKMNTDGKLSPQEKQALSEYAITKAITAVEAVIGKELEYGAADLHDKVAALVREAKMEWANSGILNLEQMEEHASKFFEWMAKQQEEEDE